MRRFGASLVIAATAVATLTPTGLAAAAQADCQPATRVAGEYRAVSRQLNLAEWRQRPAGQRYVDNVMRLVLALQ